MKTIVFLLFIGISNGNLLAQNEKETILYIKDVINSYPVATYTHKCYSHNDFNIGDAKLLYGENFSSDTYEHLFIYERAILAQHGTTTFIHLMDISRISSVKLTQLEFGRGKYYNTLVLNFKPNSLCKKKIPIGDGSFSEQNINNTVEISLNLSFEELEKLKRAFIHLCKLYGGAPLDENLFDK